MKIYTSYYGSRYLDPSQHSLVRISNSAPKGFPVNAVLSEAIPNWDTIVKPYKEGALDTVTYNRLYRRQLDANAFTILLSFTDIFTEADGKDIVLLCYEKPGDFCHRHIFAKWLEEHSPSLVSMFPDIGTIEIEELGSAQLNLF